MASRTCSPALTALACLLAAAPVAAAKRVLNVYSWADYIGPTTIADFERETGIPIDRYRIGSPGLADLGGFAAAYGVGDEGAVLVRPDGHVAWRSADGRGARPTLREAVQQIAGS